MAKFKFTIDDLDKFIVNALERPVGREPGQVPRLASFLQQRRLPPRIPRQPIQRIPSLGAAQVPEIPVFEPKKIEQGSAKYPFLRPRGFYPPKKE